MKKLLTLLLVTFCFSLSARAQKLNEYFCIAEVTAGKLTTAFSFRLQSGQKKLVMVTKDYETYEVLSYSQAAGEVVDQAVTDLSSPAVFVGLNADREGTELAMVLGYFQTAELALKDYRESAQENELLGLWAWGVKGQGIPNSYTYFKEKGKIKGKISYSCSLTH